MSDTKIVDLELCGNQHSIDSEIRRRYSKLLRSTFENKSLWQHICEGTLSGSTSYEGKLYRESATRLMVVGRAMNGWEEDYSGCENVDDVTQKILDQDFQFSDIIKEDGISCDGRKNYFYSRSNFWKLIHCVLQNYHEANHEWYDPTKNANWNEKIVWSNLYEIAPRNSGNPEWKMIKPDMQNYIDIMKLKLVKYKPKRVLFVTDSNYFEPWKRQPSFAKEFGVMLTDRAEGYVVGVGSYNGIRMVVCKRPDVYGITGENIHQMAHEIMNAFGDTE